MSRFPALHRVSPRRTLSLAAAVAVSLAALTASPAWAHGPRHGDPGMGAQGMFMAGPERVQRMVDHWLRDLNATPEQRQQIVQIAESAAKDLGALRDSRKALREEGLRLFTQPTVDANAVESLRQRQLALHDQTSRRMSQAMLEVSRVLTPEQRQTLAERMKQRAQRWEEHRRGQAGSPGR
ncbi:Spy/CpxP family protein refolding chaperone [Schlegelella aquatica]|uniref:Spy/CpxP family protein refolding chaperone n=1 Tax=Caldimonas aquatica TaxID=376175 RepID=UPI0037509B69